jgi:mRNA-degrading endonuclease toxin of MazEF toxin-antitoxin module
MSSMVVLRRPVAIHRSSRSALTTPSRDDPVHPASSSWVMRTSMCVPWASAAPKRSASSTSRARTRPTVSRDAYSRRRVAQTAGEHAQELRARVAPVTRTLRRAPSQLPLGRAEGLPGESVGSFDDLVTVPKSMLVRRLGSLGPRQRELCTTLQALAGC